MKLVEPEVAEPRATYLPTDQSVVVNCPPGCIRGKVYFDSRALYEWLSSRRRMATIEHVKARFRCAVCGELPAKVRLISKLHNTKLAVLPGM